MPSSGGPHGKGRAHCANGTLLFVDVVLALALVSNHQHVRCDAPGTLPTKSFLGPPTASVIDNTQQGLGHMGDPQVLMVQYGAWKSSLLDSAVLSNQW